MKRVFLSALAVLAAACAVSSNDAPSSSGSSAAPIINGTDSPGGGPQDAVILLVTTDSGFGACSGSLIAPNLVLTARHCVSKTSDKAFGCDADGNLFGGGTQVSGDHDPTAINVYYGNTRPQFGNGPVTPAAKGAKIFHNGAKTLCNADIALLLLDAPIDGAQIAPLRLDAPPVVNETFTAVGWGVTVVDPYPDIRQQRPNVKIKRVGRYESAIEAVPVNEFLIGEAICSGDSGGPAMATSSGAILGVVSRGGNGTSDPNDPAVGCMGGTNFYTRVDGFRDMILQAFEEAGQEPWLEGGPDPRLAKLGVTCGGDGECRSNICLATKGVCSQDCSTDACPTGYQCGTDNGRKVCIPFTPSTGGCNTSGETSGTLGLGLAALFAITALRKRRA
jgi:MYXO-CTERM domain-containing protein